MNANELMFGNYLQEITSNDVFQVEKSFFTLLNLNLKTSKPILISEKWLLDFGFVSNNNWHYYLGENPVTNDYLLDICWIDGYEYPFFLNGHFKIKYVHQLQNLYFSLTGKPLLLVDTKKHFTYLNNFCNEITNQNIMID